MQCSDDGSRELWLEFWEPYSPLQGICVTPFRVSSPSTSAIWVPISCSAKPLLTREVNQDFSNEITYIGHNSRFKNIFRLAPFAPFHLIVSRVKAFSRMQLRHKFSVFDRFLLEL